VSLKNTFVSYSANFHRTKFDYSTIIMASRQLLKTKEDVLRAFKEHVSPHKGAFYEKYRMKVCSLFSTQVDEFFCVFISFFLFFTVG
tara:strand:- start:2328 stop:2588 length:261 start_codon:yes stop_codon:yes gene_type:complete